MDVWELAIRESVRQTLADYTAATDRFDLAALAGCFSPAGVLEFTGGTERLLGPDAIEAGLRAALGRPPDGRPSPTHIRHHVSSVRFAVVTEDRVEVSSYFIVHTDVGLDHWGRYRDMLAPSESGRWLFAHKRISVDAFSPNSLMNTGD